MRIGIDIDEVLCETLDFALHFFEGKIAWKPLNRTQVSDYYLPNIPWYETVSREEAVRFFVEAQNAPRALEELKPVHWAYEVLKKRKSDWHSLYAITARGEPVKSATEAWIQKYFPKLFDEIIFCNHYRDAYPRFSKEDICKQKGIKLFVEDNPKYAIDLEAMDIKVFLLDKPRNQSFLQQEHPWILKVAGRESIKNVSLS